MSYVALLRGINVGGNRRIKMDPLKSVFRTIGLTDPVALLQSGNIMFASDEGDIQALTKEIENAVELAFGFRVDVVIRTGREMAELLDSHPFTETQLEDPRMAHVMFFKDHPDPDRYGDLRAAHEGPEEIRLIGHELFIHYPDGSGRSRLTGSAIEKFLGAKGTARNWNTILKIGGQLSAVG